MTGNGLCSSVVLVDHHLAVFEPDVPGHDAGIEDVAPLAEGAWPALADLFQLAARLGCGNLANGVGQGVDVLRAHDRIFALEQEAWHA